MIYLVIGTDSPLAEMDWSDEVGIVGMYASEQEAWAAMRQYLDEHPERANEVVVVQVLE